MNTTSTRGPGRNDPCPCGSGQKYKKCCAEADARRSRTLRLLGNAPAVPAAPAGGGPHPSRPGVDRAMHSALVAAARSGAWEVAAVPLNIAFDDAPENRAVGVLVVARGLVIDGDLITMRSSEPVEVARILADHVASAARTTGHWPRTIAMRHASVAPPLGQMLAEHGVEVLVRDVLPDLDAAASGLGAQMAAGPRGSAATDIGSIRPAGSVGTSGGDPRMPPYPMVSFPDRWASWGLPEDLVEGIFAAATRFHAAKPWAHLSNTEVLELAFPDGGRPTACVMGSAGLEFGLVLYDELDDFVRLIDADGEYFPAPKGSVVTLEFVPKGEVSRGMRREIMTGKWPLPAGDAYPRILALNTPAGGLSRARAEMLRLALDAVARFVTEREADIVRHSVSDPPLEWLHAESGVTVIFAGDIDHEISMFDAPVVRLHGGGASGPGADPEDFARGEGEGESLWERDRAVVAEFDRALAEGQGGRRPLAQATARFHAMIAGAFVDCLCGHHGAGLGAVHEYDLRVFLYDWFPRKVSMGRTDAFRVPVSLGKFFRFLADEKGIVCRWASWILDDRELFEERWAAFPGGFWWDAPVIDWRSELRPDLDARVLVPSGDLAGHGSWGATMGVREAQLFGELSRRWLAWREEVIAGGVVDPADVRRILGERQRAWELAPHARHGGASPSAVVQRERSATRRTRPPNVIP